MAYPDLRGEAQALKITPKDVEIKDLKYRSQLYDYENLLKILKDQKSKYLK